MVRNSTILVDFIDLRRSHGMSLEQAVVDAGAVRFRPMLLTAAAVVVVGARVHINFLGPGSADLTRHAISDAPPNQKIPIVFVVAGDPVAEGIVASMSRPGGNLTGLTSLNASADAKRLGLLKEAMPALRRVVLLASRGDPATKHCQRNSQRRTIARR